MQKERARMPTIFEKVHKTNEGTRGRVCVSVGRVFASETRGLQFKSSHGKTFILNHLLTVPSIEKKRGREMPIYKTFMYCPQSRNKRPGNAHFYKKKELKKQNCR